MTEKSTASPTTESDLYHSGDRFWVLHDELLGLELKTGKTPEEILHMNELGEEINRLGKELGFERLKFSGTQPVCPNERNPNWGCEDYGHG